MTKDQKKSEHFYRQLTLPHAEFTSLHHSDHVVYYSENQNPLDN